MSLLDELIPTPRLVELDRAELAAPAAQVWELVRHGDLGRSALIRALFALRTLPDRLHGREVDVSVRIDNLVSSPERPGFRLFGEEAPHTFAVGAIGKVWQLEIPFVYVPGAREFAAFAEPGFVKVAWSVTIQPHGERACEVVVEVRVDATDDASWSKFARYFALIGPGSHFIRRTVLAWLTRELGTLDSVENERDLPGDELLGDAAAQVTHGITIAAAPERIWPWLLQMGCRRAGFYAIDALDNGGVPSARELHPELTKLELGQVIPASPESDEGFEVLRLNEPRVLVLGGLYDTGAQAQLPFGAARPPRFWQVTWAFVLEPLGPESTRLHVRARAAFTPSERLHLAAIRPVHRFLQKSMLKHLAERVEGRLPRDTAADVWSGLGGALVMLAALASPFLRGARSHWGLDAELAGRAYPGDELLPDVRWGWTHGVEVDAPAARVWPWVAQIGADRGGFYSYQWLENLAGCEVQNTERVHPEWEAKLGQSLVLHPDPRAPRLQIVALEPGRWLVASGPADAAAQRAGKPWTAASWLFFIEPLDDQRCRVISRYRAACSDDVATRLAFGPALVEPVGFAMDRRMLLGLKERAERAERSG